MSRIRLIQVVCLGVLLCVANDQLVAKELRFRGRQLIDKKAGLFVAPQKPIGVAVSSTRYHFWVLLSYSETWTLESTETQPLIAADEHHAVTIALYPPTDGGTSAYLEGVLESLRQNDSVEIRKAEFVTERNRTILKYQAAPTREGPWFWNYWTAVEHSKRGIALHLSVLNVAFRPSSGESRLRIFLSSLEADFREK